MSNKSDLDRLQALDAALNEEQIAADIDKVLSHKTSFSLKANNNNNIDNTRYMTSISNTEKHTAKDDPDVPTIEKYYDKSDPNNRGNEEQRSTPNPMIPDPERAPETADRYSKAKLLMMTKQLNDAADLRQKMEDHIKDLQQQLKNSREENNVHKKKIQQLESDMRKANMTKRGGETSSAENNEALVQEVKALKKDIATFERMAKQSEENSKNKDGQLKRAADTIARLKIQLQEAQTQVQNGVAGDHNRAEALEQRVRVLEKQRAELIDGFKKQMKLIDVLKRQKIHLEAARLLAFTEEEFLKTLEWKA